MNKARQWCGRCGGGDVTGEVCICTPGPEKRIASGEFAAAKAQALQSANAISELLEVARDSISQGAFLGGRVVCEQILAQCSRLSASMAVMKATETKGTK